MNKIATLQEVNSQYDLIEILDAHILLDLQEEVQRPKGNE